MIKMIKEYMIGLLERIPYGHYVLNPYIFSLLVVVLTAVGAWLILFIFEKVFLRWTAKTKTDLDDLIVEKVKKPLFFLILVYGLRFAVLNLYYTEGMTKFLNSLMAVVFVFILVRAVDVTIEVWAKAMAHRTKSKLDDVLLPLFHKASKVIFIIVGLMWLLDIWGISITPYLAGAGIIGLVMGFALQDSLKNVFGGVTLLLDKTYQIGDKIKLESGELGEVMDVGLRSTKLRTYDNELIYVPNGYMANSRVQNYTRPSAKLRVNVDFGVEYGTSVGTVQKTVLGAIKKMKEIMADPAPEVIFREMDDSSLAFRARFWIERWQEGYNKKIEATQVIYEALNKAKIGIPFPTRTVYVKKGK